MLSIDQLRKESPELQDRCWPPVPKFIGFNQLFKEFLSFPLNEQRQLLENNRQNTEDHDKLVQEYLGEIYSYVLGYEDSPCYLIADDELEIKLQQSKILLERELMNSLLNQTLPLKQKLNQAEAAEYLRQKILDNYGVEHKLFDYIKNTASKSAISTFLQNEVIRNEVVDDEIAWLVNGLQGLLKKVAASNLWDECGRGKLKDFHTYWLRMFLEESDGWNKLIDYRQSARPWFAKITSNSLNMLLTRPGYKYIAYGYLLISESWVEPHFEKILAGMSRVGFSTEGLSVYFTAHLKIDPYHTNELLEGLADQEPNLSQIEVDQVILGAQLAIAAGTAQYDRMLPYLSSMK
jgi:hypothetical protein